ncbi:MAG: glycosyl transferase [Deltaproteobacteria bacterium RBG_16_64_85]|nr:MAG: glycosyl transferase [Deltaproteobacteria bacterium RBG_16_64_85]
MKLAPITLFAYKRLWHTRATVEALQKNVLAMECELIVFSDGPRTNADKADVLSVREYLKTVTGFKNVSVTERGKNLGLAQSIIAGVSEVVNQYGRIIVLEDDLLSSPFFLKFMNEGLEYYKDEDKVISINGYLFPVIARLPETFFLKGADCWGWATWKRGWDLFEPDGEKLLGDMRKRHLKKEFDFNGAYPYTKMLEDQTRGKNNSWAIRWYASAFLNDKLTLYPGRSLTKNIGTDASGTHCVKTDLYESQISLNPIEITDIPIEENRSAREEFGRFMKEVQPGLGVRVKSMATNFFKA